MAMHVPKAPGFAQMMKDGAQVYIIEYSNWCNVLIFQIKLETDVIIFM